MRKHLQLLKNESIHSPVSSAASGWMMLFLLFLLPGQYASGQEHSVARLWNEAQIDAVRLDSPRPTIHARNLFHASAAMYDGWAAYDVTARPFLLGNSYGGYQCSFEGITMPLDIEAARDETISFAAYRILSHRFSISPNASTSLAEFDDLMNTLGYDSGLTSMDYANDGPAALGNYIGNCMIEAGLQDGANEADNYAAQNYITANTPLIVGLPGNPLIEDVNRWQPLVRDFSYDENGEVVPGPTPGFLSPEWGQVVPFSLTSDDLTIYEREGNDYWVYHDPGAPPHMALGTGDGTSEDYKWNFALVSIWSSHLDPTDGVMWDISPASRGNTLADLFPQGLEGYGEFYDMLNGSITANQGRDVNPYTGQPYETQMVPRGDYGRVLAEFWADGPNSETPPGHWFTIFNEVNDHPALVKKIAGNGEVVGNLEWDVKGYFLLGAAMHDVAISVWGIKSWHDYIRPVSAIRSMADRGQSTDDTLPNYSPDGIPLVDGYIEVIEEGDELAGETGENIGKIKLYAWKGPDYIEDPADSYAGVGWILAENWWPYQRPSFITPPFAGYVSGHSTFSRAAAEVLTMYTGDEYFPGGLGEFHFTANDYLVFEDGPSVDVTLQWATYRDASDETSLSRIWGGIHPPIDDIPGRQIGIKIANQVFDHATSFFIGTATDVEDRPTALLDFNVDVYPNPVGNSRKINITMDQPRAEVEVRVFNLLGQEVFMDQFSGRQQAMQLEANTLPSGIYMLRITSDGHTTSQAITIL